MKLRRSKLELLINLVEFLSERPALPTAIMYRVNLSYTTLNETLSAARKNEFIETTRKCSCIPRMIGLHARDHYGLTPRGREFLEKSRSLVAMLK